MQEHLKLLNDTFAYFKGGGSTFAKNFSKENYRVLRKFIRILKKFYRNLRKFSRIFRKFYRIFRKFYRISHKRRIMNPRKNLCLSRTFRELIQKAESSKPKREWTHRVLMTFSYSPLSVLASLLKLQPFLMQIRPQSRAKLATAAAKAISPLVLLSLKSSACKLSL